MVKEYLNELPINCEYVDRGCQENVQLQHLDRHEAACGFKPVTCTNQGCGATVSWRDLVHHESEICEFRKLKCHSCGEMSKTLENMEKKMTKIEMNLETKIGNLETSMTRMEQNMEQNTAEIKTDTEGKLQTVNNEVRGLKAALIEGFDQMKEVLVKMENSKEETTRKISADKEKKNIVVAGGLETDSVEMFNWCQKLWSPLQSMPKERHGASSFVYNNHVTIAGGDVETMIRMNVYPNPDPSVHWSDCLVKLPVKLSHHSSVLYNDQLLVAGGYNGNLGEISDSIYGVQLVPPYTVKTPSRMPEQRQGHSIEMFDDNMLIVGGSTTNRYRDNLKNVTLYDVKNDECKQLAPLPYEVSDMATVRWKENIVVIGGADKHGKALDTVVVYNVKTEQSHMLPPMRCKRRGCAAVVIGNNIVVLGLSDGQRALKSVEAFNFDRNTWEELPEMSQGRSFHTAVVV